jgi:hypothetical protein
MWYTLYVKQDYANGQLSLGLIYALGNDVIQDNFTAPNGNKNGVKLRNFVAKKMTSADISTYRNLPVNVSKKIQRVLKRPNLIYKKQ